jgi:hypothetical protein
MATARTCRVVLNNSFGQRITNVSLKHRNDGIGDFDENVGTMENNSTAGPFNCRYETGFNSSTDHWQVTFTDENGITRTNDLGFDCSPESEDEGKTINVIIAQRLIVTLSDGDKCEEEFRTV